MALSVSESKHTGQNRNSNGIQGQYHPPQIEGTSASYDFSMTTPFEVTPIYLQGNLL